MNRGRRNPRELVQSRIKQPRLDEDNGDSLVLEELSTNAHAATELCHGSILRIRLINFLTYDEVEFKPGPNLNVIVGPNGTGKSSIVCALCVGLGEKPSTLGRAKEIWEFVKHRKNRATIEIELKNQKGANYAIKREIFKAERRSTWFFNGKATTFGEVQSKMKDLNIQMSNLCQFLPQDKVVEFAKMSQQDLLEATEKAVGPPGMHKDHKELIELREKEKGFEASLRAKMENKERLEQKNALLQREVERYKERQKHLNKIILLERKRPWAEYDIVRQQYVDAKALKEASEKNLKDAKKEHGPLEEELGRISQVSASLRQQKLKLNEDISESTMKTKRTSDQMEKQSEKILEINSELKSIKEQERQRQKRIRDMEKNIEALENDFEQAPDPADLRPRYQEITDEMREVNREISTNSQEASSLKDEGDSIKANLAALNRRLKEINDIGNRRMQKLSQVDKEAFDAVQWLNNNKNKFKGHVYEPILLQINLKNSDDAKFLEAIVSFRDLVAFVCESQEDQNLFLQEVREKQNLAVNVLYAPSHQTLSEYKPRRTLDQIKQYGFSCFASDLFDAPEPVMRYLYESYNLYDIPIAREDVQKNINEAIEKSGIGLFFTPSQKYKTTQSLYGNRNKSTMSSTLQEKKLLSVSVDLEMKKQVETEKVSIEKRYTEIGAQHGKCVEIDNRLKKKLDQLRCEKKELQTQMNRRRTLDTQIESKRKTLETIAKESVDIEKEENSAKKKISALIKKRVELAMQLKTNIQACLDAGKERLALSLKGCQYDAKRKYYVAQKNEFASKLRQLEDEFSQFKEQCDSLKATAKRKLENAKKITNKTELSSEDRDLFATLPDSLDEIDDLIHEEKAKADCTSEIRPQVLNEYKKNNAEIKELIRQIDEESDDHSSINQKIADVKERWLTPLESLIQRINEQYSDFFKRMGCAGQVALFKDPDDNYSKYGIEIKVMYRSTERLKVLTAHHQSGGERSVATMLYLISLQELTKCPFRVVDEINQGMDPSNERRVFELVVETVCRPGSSQYFLITPKLLPDLKYTDRMTVLSVWNGHWLSPNSQFNVQDFLNKKKMNKS